MPEITPVLEPAAQAFADATANPPFVFDMPVADGRRTVDSVQDGVPVTAERYEGIIHDFVMLNAMRDTQAARAATAQGGEFLRAALHG